MKRLGFGVVFGVSAVLYLACGGDDLVSGTTPDGGADDGGPSSDGSAFDGSSHDAAPNDASSFDAGPKDAAPIDAAVDATPDGGVDGGDAGAHAYYIDPTTGLDTNAGTMGAPFLTLTKAAAVARDGDQVWLVDGDYDPTTQGILPITFADGVSIEAVHSHAAVLRGVTVTFSGRATMTGLDIARFVASNTDSQIQVPTGSDVHIVDAVFDQNDTIYPVVVTGGTGHLTSSGSILTGGRLASANAGTLIVTGGMANGAGQSDATESVIEASGTSSVTLSGFTCLADHVAVVAMDSAHVSITDGSLLFAGSTHDFTTGSLVVLSGSPTVDVTGSTISSGSNGIQIGVAGNPIPVSPTIHLDHATLTQSTSKAISTYDVTSLTISISDSTIKNNMQGGIAQTSSLGARMLNLVVRNSTFAGNDFLDVDVRVLAGSTIDLGASAAAPGGNSFSDSIASSTSLSVDAPAGFVVNAAGNVWNVSQQGADASGRYAAGTSVTGPATGRNYALTNASELHL